MSSVGASAGDIVTRETPNFLLNDVDNSITNGEQKFLSPTNRNNIFHLTEEESSFLKAQLRYRKDLHTVAKHDKNVGNLATGGGAECGPDKQAAAGMPWPATLLLLTSITRKVLNAASQAYATAWCENSSNHTAQGATAQTAMEGGNTYSQNKGVIAGDAGSGGVGKGSSVIRSAATNYPERKGGSGPASSSASKTKDSYAMRGGKTGNGINGAVDSAGAMTEAERNTSMLQPLTPAQFDEENEYILEQLQQFACAPFTLERLLEILDNPTCFHLTPNGKLRGDKLQMSLRRCVLVTCPSLDPMLGDAMY